MLKKVLGLLAVLLIGLAVLVYGFPATAYQWARSAERSYGGLEKKSVQVDNHTVVYLEGGKGETILLLHGFSGEKDNWTRFAKYLTPRYHVVIPDLPGFEESSKIEGASYGWDSQLDRIQRFTEVLGLDSFHIVGNSMGGQLAGKYAVRHPEKVLTLGLFNCGGVNPPQKSDFIASREKGVNPLLVSQMSDIDQMLKFVFYKPPYIPGFYKKEMAKKFIELQPFYNKIFAEISPGIGNMQQELNRIQAPTLILWGDKDRVLDPSSVPILESGIKRHETVIIKNCGHLPMLERPKETAQHYLDFLERNKP
ncbi:MAG: alpha/beta fold hydrolase [Bacillota bacterium]